ncbi:cytochrome P450 [Phanerochaete sordida]|uniref:Cytochrome P450 n=1 Tax=Phanerochaete sordida TaxID=48140 RepID=A0A9P3LJT9_9APHY|nr:cytochrome P450 [Phanerochaete sordida]
MYPLGLLALVQHLGTHDAALKLAIALPSVVLLALLYSWARTRKEQDDDDPPFLPLSIWETVWPFFTTRHDFIARGFELTRAPAFRFKLLQHTVVVLSREHARADFFACRGLDIHEGFKVLSGAIPMLPGVTSDLQARTISLIHRRLAAAQGSDHLQRLIPCVLQDIQHLVRSWGAAGSTIDPFTHIPALLFQTTVRCLAGHELAEDAATVARLRGLYDTLDRSTTPLSVLLPWLPSPSMLSKVWASKQVYDIIDGAIRARVAGGVAHDDTLQMLLDHGDEKLLVVGFIMGLLVAGARSTGTTASWIVTYLAGHPEWRCKVQDEVHALLSNYAATPAEGVADRAAQFATVPLEAFEQCMPAMDAVIRETLRVAQPHTAMRRNVGPETYVGGVRVPSGAYVVYPFSDIHLDAALYPDPWRFDPGRAESTAPLGYVGWGGGRTVCLGQRLAKLQMKLVLSTLLLDSDFSLVDQFGQQLGRSPRPNWNDHLTCKPPSGSCYVRLGDQKY